MTEDAAVFGGLNNMIDGLANAYSLYKPKMIHVSTTCMAEVIGDDLNAFIQNAKEKGSVPQDFDVPFAHTPAFVGSHVTGYDNSMKGIVSHFWGGRERTANGRINFIGGFDGFSVGNLREIKRLFRPHGRRIHHPRRQQRRVRHADRRPFPHVRRRDEAGRRQGGPGRRGDGVDAGVLHREDPGLLRREGARRWRPSTIRSGSRPRIAFSWRSRA